MQRMPILSDSDMSMFELKTRYVRNYLTFAGKNSKDYLLYISGPGVYDSPAVDVELQTIPGKNGDIVRDNAKAGEHRFKNLDITYDAFFFDGLSARTASVKSWLLSPVGYQVLHDTYDPDFFRMGLCKAAIAKNIIANTHTAIISNTTTSWETIKTTIFTKLTEIKNKVDEVLNAIKQKFNDTFTEIVNIVRTKMAEANTEMTSALNTMKNNVDSACSAIKSSVTSYLSMGSDAYQWGRDICIEMAAGINAEAWRVEQAAARLAAAVDDTLGFSVPEEGPLSHADEYMPDFMELMAKGIRDSGKLVMQSVRELSESMGTAFTGLVIPEIGVAQLAMAGAGASNSTINRNVTINGLSVNVSGYEAKNDSDLADTIVHRINEMLNEDESVWGR